MTRLAVYTLSLAFALAGCGEDESASPVVPERRIACALAGEADFSDSCTVDRVVDARGTLLTVHQPDGGFHRLRVADDGTGLVAADGAIPAQTRVVGTEIEVTIGNARYRLPMAARK